MGNGERTVRMDHGIDPRAPRGSRKWANAQRVLIQSALASEDMHVEGTIAIWRDLIEERAWTKMDPPVESFEEFRLEPYPLGLGPDPENPRWDWKTIEPTVKLLVKEAGYEWALLTRPSGETPRSGEIGRNRRSDRTANKHRGETVTYLVRRIERDAPKVFAQLEAGEFPSVRAAAIAAGIVKVPTPFEAAQKAILKLTAKELRQLTRWMEER